MSYSYIYEIKGEMSMEKDVYEEFGIQVGQFQDFSGLNSFSHQGYVYVLVPITHMNEDEIMEKKRMSDFFSYDGTVGKFVPTKKGKWIAKIGETKMVLLCAIHDERSIQIGEDMATFHYYGRTYPYEVKYVNILGQWKTLWGRRIDQLENFGKQKINDIQTKFDEQFITSLPYFIGISENAIQYLVDAEMDEERGVMDTAVICTERFLYRKIKLPTEWVYDHPARDIAEWIRLQWKKEHQTSEVRNFLADYEQFMPLSSFSLRLVYARLLFPIAYFEAVEGYYGLEEDRKKYEDDFYKVISQISTNEKRLSSIFGTFERKLPSIRWLQKADSNF